MATNVNTNTALIQVDVQTGLKTVTLPEALSFPGRLLTVKDKFGNCSNFNITITPIGGNTIDGSSSNYILSNNGAAVSFVSDGVSRWMTLNSPSVPFTGSSISLSTNSVVASTLNLIDQTTFGISNLYVSTGRLLFSGNEIPLSQLLTISTQNLNFYNAYGSNIFLNYLYSVSGVISSLQTSNLRAQDIITSTITGNQFIGDGSRLSNLILPSTSVITPQFAMYTVSSGTQYSNSPWGTQIMNLSTVATQLSPFYLTLNNSVLRISTANTQAYRISYMMGGNENTLTTLRPTFTMVLSTPTNVIYYPSIENFEGGGGSISFLENLNSNSQILFYMRGLSNYTFTSDDAFLYRMTFETIGGTSSDIFSTINVWTNYNRFVSTVDFDNAVNLNGTTNSSNFLASNVTVNGSQTTTGNITAGQSSIANSIYTNYLRVMSNSIIGPGSITMSNNNINTSNLQTSTLSMLDMSTMTYRALFISTGTIYYGSNVVSAGGSGAGGSTISSLFVGSASNANFIKFWGSIGEYNNTVIAQQSTGSNSSEFLFFEGSSIRDEIRFQTTGSVRFETGVPGPRNYNTANQVQTPSLFISTGTAIGLFTSSPQFNLDVIGTARFTSSVSTTSLYAGALYFGLFFA